MRMRMRLIAAVVLASLFGCDVLEKTAMKLSGLTGIIAGPCERGPLDPTLIASRAEYTALYGGYFRGSLANANTYTSDLSPTIAEAVDQFFGNGGESTYILRAISNPGSAATATRAVSGLSTTFNLDASSPGAWANNYVVGGIGVGGASVSFGVYAVIGPATSYTGSWPVAGPADSSTPFRIVVLYVAPGTAGRTDTPDTFGVDGAPVVVEDWDGLTASTAAATLAASEYIRWNGSADVPAAYDVTSNGNGDGPPTLIDYTLASTVLTGLTGGVGDDHQTTL